MAKDLNDYQPVQDYSKAGPLWVQAAYERDRLQKKFDAHQEHLQKKQALQLRREQFMRDAWEKRNGQRQETKGAEDAGEEKEASRREVMAGEVRVKMENENENETAQSVQEDRPRQYRGQKRAREEEEHRDVASNVGLPQIARRNGPSALPPYPGPRPVSSNEAQTDLSVLRQQRHNGVLGAAIHPPPPMRAPLHVPPSHHTGLRTTANQHQQSSSSRLHASLPGPNAPHHPFPPDEKYDRR
ncbi:hypothetical protein CKM354_000879500 [Cercospora kikuchii]|uniref:Uncharacterized protein n=1 Tax=Cercospora kikuchii TaxID=84275 RepID=A0A9P3CQD8_9PEZI|nr:uncharacterized protein CKM354_000879500 [Cercospora kikuchii]GIZ45637.1 hypothetical protein CKM354_000879500 [Cercospora kikuchii]